MWIFKKKKKNLTTKKSGRTNVLPDLDDILVIKLFFLRLHTQQHRGE